MAYVLLILGVLTLVGKLVVHVLQERHTNFVKGRIVGRVYTIQASLARAPWAATYAALTEPNREVVLRVTQPELLATRRDAVDRKSVV